MRKIAHFFYAKNQTNYMLYAVTAIALFLIIPIKATFYVVYDSRNKKIYFTAFLYEVIRVFSGYLRIVKNVGGYLHLKNKAFCIKYNSILKMDKSPITLKAFTLTEVLSESYVCQHSFSVISGITVSYLAIQSCSKLLQNKLPYLKLNNNLYINSKNVKRFSVNAKITILFNLFGLIINACENLIKKGVKDEKE